MQVLAQGDYMRSSPDATQNHLLAALPDVTRERWLRQLERVEMPRGQVLKEQDRALQYAYFPTTAIVSLEYLTRDGDSTEIAVVGNEGIVGFGLFMGGDSAPYRAVVLLVQARAFGCRHRPSRTSSTAAARRCIRCCAMPRP